MKGTSSNGLLAEFVSGASRFLFFTGNGGVGKTSLACATAVTRRTQKRPTVP